MIRRIINRVRRLTPSSAPQPIETIGLPRHQAQGNHVALGDSPRRGATLTPMAVAKARRRAANKRARASRRDNRA